MSARERLSAIALLCDPEGIILRVVYDGLSLGDRPGEPFMSLLDSGSLEKARNFLETIRTQGVASDWELNISIGERIRLLHFAGNQAADGIFIAAAITGSGLARVFEECVSINNMQTKGPDAGGQSPARQPVARAAEDGEYYNEITRLNNELMTLQRDLIKKNVKLEELNEQKSQFIGMAAHDMRNPLQVIDSVCQLLLRQALGNLTEEQARFISVIKKNSDFMLKLINDLLQISRIESGKLQLELQQTDLASLIRVSVELTGLLAEQKQIRVVFNQDEPVPEIMVDPSKVEQILDNLISNAIKFSHPQSMIDVSLTRRENGLVISVKDEGQGIPQSELDRLFNPFERTSVRSTGGEQSTGLGLSITRRMVLAHNGDIWVESEVGKGSTFYVLLPFNKG